MLSCVLAVVGKLAHTPKGLSSIRSPRLAWFATHGPKPPKQHTKVCGLAAESQHSLE